MKTVLQVNSSILGGNSESGRLVKAFIDQLDAEQVIVRDLAKEPVPHLDGERFGAFITPAEKRSAAQADVVAYSDKLIDEVRRADTLVIGLPMYNFGVPSGFKALIDNRAVDIIHPDPLTSGAIRETKRICDYASMNGVQTAIHFAGSPVGCLASVHMAATLKDMLAMENHAVDIPWWGDLVTGPAKPIVDRGYIQVPDAPGLGVELNEAVVKQHIRMGGYFEPTPQYDDYILDRFRLGGPYPHLDENGNPVVKQ